MKQALILATGIQNQFAATEQLSPWSNQASKARSAGGELGSARAATLRQLLITKQCSCDHVFIAHPMPATHGTRSGNTRVPLQDRLTTWPRVIATGLPLAFVVSPMVYGRCYHGG
jgi:hypothetical protein